MSARRFNRHRRASLLSRLDVLAAEQDAAARAFAPAILLVLPMWHTQFAEAAEKMCDGMDRFAAAFSEALRKMAESLAGSFIVLPEGARVEIVEVPR